MKRIYHNSNFNLRCNNYTIYMGKYVRFEVPMAVTTKITAFWGVMLCSLAEVY
jgi:hypothetical protein